VSILRGIKGKYEAHHGVRILDAALITATTLSSRYIANRFLPDKAIDLMDEACAAVRVALDSQPEPIERLEQRTMRLSVEEAALKKEDDKASVKRRKKVTEELERLNDELLVLRSAYDVQKKQIEKLAEIKKESEDLRWAIEQNELRYNIEKVSELQLEQKQLKKQYNAIVKEMRGQGESLFVETVGPEQIATVVSRWTGVPVSKLSTNEKGRLLDLHARLGGRVVGQPLAVESVADAILRTRAGLGHRDKPTVRRQ
jgi:ATP-dependent Clp protease ATP-binding subunit ClpB